MKRKKFFTIGLLFVSLVALLSAAFFDFKFYKKALINNYIRITNHPDKTYSYEILDYNGKVLISEMGLIHLPKREQIDTDIVGVSVQAGTGLSTRRTVYCNLQNSKISEAFYAVLAAQGSYVIYADYAEQQQRIVIRDIFNEAKYYEVYQLENVSDVAADFVADCKIKDGSAVVTYFSGENYDETEITINFP